MCLKIMQTRNELWGAGSMKPQNGNKILVHLYHEVQSIYSVLGDEILPLKTFLSGFNV